VNTRRLLLHWALPLLGIVLAFVVARHFMLDFYASMEPVLPQEGKTTDVTGGEGALTSKQFTHRVTEKLDLLQKDRTGRVTMRFYADKIVHRSDNASEITGLRLQHFTKAGEVITLVGNEATIYRTGGESLSIENIESGTIRGNVLLSHDRGTPDDRSDDVFVTVQDLKFDNETYEMRTDGPVIMAAPEMDLTARKMLLVLDKNTGRVNTMTFFEDIVISLETGNRLQMSVFGGPLSGPGAPPEAPLQGPVASAPTAPAAAAKAPAASPPKKGPAATPAANAPGRYIWEIDLAGDVDARQMDYRLSCDRLKLYSETAGPAAEAGNKPPSEMPEGQPKPAAPGPAKEAAGAGAGGAPKAGKPAEPDIIKQENEEALPPLVVLANGPLIITPVDPADTQAMAARYDVTATGRPAVVLDRELRIEGSQVTYNTKTGGGSVVGTDGPMLLDQPGRMHLDGDRLDFDRGRGTAKVTGRGNLHARLDTQGLTGVGPVPPEQSPETPAEGGQGTLEATWERGMDLVLVTPAPGQAGGPTEIRRAEFHGQAVVKEREQVLRGDDLAIDFFPAETSEYALAMPRIAEGAGAAKILQWTVDEGRRVVAGDLLAVVEAPIASPGPGGAPTQAPARAELHSIRDSHVLEIRKHTGDVVQPGEIIAILASKGNQAVERLVGHGDVFIENKAPAAPGHSPPGAERSPAANPDDRRSQVGDITCQDLDVRFARQPMGGSEPAELKAKGHVTINDPQGKVQAEDLAVQFTRNKDGRLDIGATEARGKVAIDRGDLHAAGEYVNRDPAGGVLILEGGPAVAARQDRRIVGERIEFRQAEGKARVTGKGELRIPATTDLRGRPRSGSDPLEIRWTRGMVYDEGKNFALFDGNVAANTGGSRLDAEKLWIYFKDRPPQTVADRPADSHTASSAGVSDLAAGVSGSAARGTGETSAPGPNEVDRLLGEKAIERVLAEKNVHTVDQQVDEDGALRFRFELTGENLTYLEANRKAYMRDPGMLRILARERPAKGRKPPPGLQPNTPSATVWQGALPDGYARTQVSWAESMAYDGATGRAYFSGDAEAVHVGRGLAEGGAAPSDNPSHMRLRSGDLQVVFRQDQSAGPTDKTAPEERMALEQLVADKGTQLWFNERCGSGYRLIYQRDPELVRIFSGPTGYARLWQEDEAKQEYGLVVGRTITYHPSSGHIEVVDQKVITGSPKP